MSDNTIYDVARKAGVSASTVSRVINQRAGVNSETTRKVNHALNELNFRPRWKAAPAKSIGVIVHPHHECLANPFVSTLLSAISEMLFAEGYTVQLIPRKQSDSSINGLAGLVSTHTIQGVIIIPMHQFYGLSERLSAEHFNVPHVVIGMEQHDTAEDCSYYRIGTDDITSGKQLATFLLRQNLKTFEIVSPDQRDCCHSKRILGILSSLKKAGIDPQSIPIHEYSDVTVSNGKAAAAEIATQPELPDAVIVTDSSLAMGFCAGCIQAGIHIPDDMSIVGFEDADELETTAPPLTAMKQPTRKMGEMAVQLLLAQIHEQALDNIPGMLKHSLVIRNSVTLGR